MHQSFIRARFPFFPFSPIVPCRIAFFQTDKIDLTDVLFTVADNITHIPIPDTGIGNFLRTGRPAVQPDLTPVPPILIQFLQKQFLCRTPPPGICFAGGSFLPFSCWMSPGLICWSHFAYYCPNGGAFSRDISFSGRKTGVMPGKEQCIPFFCSIHMINTTKLGKSHDYSIRNTASSPAGLRTVPFFELKTLTGLLICLQKWRYSAQETALIRKLPGAARSAAR